MVANTLEVANNIMRVKPRAQLVLIITMGERTKSHFWSILIKKKILIGNTELH